MPDADPPRSPGLLARLGPGLLVAATGVGAGDLLTTALAGAEVGVWLAWAAALGAVLKWALSEGIARWQLATDTTLLEGWTTVLGKWTLWVFLAYFFIWSLVVGVAIINACGVAGDAFLPLGERSRSRLGWGIIHSLVGLGLVWLGGFKLFERVMSLCIATMFAGVIVTAFLMRPDWAAVGRGLVAWRVDRPSIQLAMGVLGGVGGTVTILAYGYWIREAGRTGRQGLRESRIDLAVAYIGTAAFAVAMLLISSRIKLERGGADVVFRLADQIGLVLGGAGRWLFLVGFWAAVFSSLLGVWQSAPYLFADALAVGRGTARDGAAADLRRSAAYRAYLVALAVVPIGFLGFTLRQIQVTYAVMGSLFMPLLALTLLILNNRRGRVGPEFRPGLALNLLLVLTLVIFAALGLMGVQAS